MINYYLPKIKIRNRIKEIEVEDELKKMIREKFNGHIIMKNFSWLKDKELGKCIENFRNKFKEKFNEYILNTEQTKIIEDFRIENNLSEEEQELKDILDDVYCP